MSSARARACEDAAVADTHFEELVRDALDGLPDWVAPYLEDVVVQIEEHASPDQRSLYGLYEGIPLGRDPTGFLPPSITIFREPLVRDFGRDPDELARQVRITVVHEIGHHFGIDEDRLHTLGYG
jgi:predicted Zn-dependent protease with MMP-like domain